MSLVFRQKSAEKRTQNVHWQTVLHKRTSEMAAVFCSAQLDRYVTYGTTLGGCVNWHGEASALPSANVYLIMHLYHLTSRRWPESWTSVWTVTLSDIVRCPWSLLILRHLNHFRWSCSTTVSLVTRSDHFSFSFTFNFAFNPRNLYTRE